MLQVLAHPESWKVVFLAFLISLRQPLPFVLLVALFSTILVQPVSAQITQNGQLFTNALTIIDAPAGQSTLHAGSNINIALEVTGNGKLPISASVPGNTGPSGYDGLDIYLVSSQTNTNLTVSFNSDILKQEPESTVKHLDWPIPTCISPGQYNLTFYECSRINDVFFYTITPVSIQIDNSNPSGAACTDGINPLEDQPQSSSPPLRSPFLPTVGDPVSSLSTIPAVASSAGTGTPSASGFVTSVTPSYPAFTSGIITVTVTAGAQMSTLFPTATVTKSANPSTVTVVMVSLQTETVTTTSQGQTDTFTTTQTTSSTMTGVMGGGKDNSGFQPVNTAPSTHKISLRFLLAVSLFFGFIGIL